MAIVFSLIFLSITIWYSPISWTFCIVVNIFHIIIVLCFNFDVLALGTNASSTSLRMGCFHLLSIVSHVSCMRNMYINHYKRLQNYDAHTLFSLLSTTFLVFHRFFQKKAALCDRILYTKPLDHAIFSRSLHQPSTIRILHHTTIHTCLCPCYIVSLIYQIGFLTTNVYP